MSGLQKFLAGLGLLAALIAGGTIGVAGIGHKYGAWPFPTARMLLEYGFYGAAGAAALALLAILIALGRRKGAGVFGAVLALAIGGGVAYVPWSMHQKELAAPLLNDVTTDLVNPPAFVTLANERKNFPNGADYDKANAARQREGYPAIVPLVSATGAGPLFAKALAEVNRQGWQIAAKDSVAGTLEATAVTQWFGFKDDIVIRIVPEGSGARLDMRSASRLTGSDMGANAERIAAFIAAVK
jgi:hypothetical protein